MGRGGVAWTAPYKCTEMGVWGESTQREGKREEEKNGRRGGGTQVKEVWENLRQSDIAKQDSQESVTGRKPGAIYYDRKADGASSGEKHYQTRLDGKLYNQMSFGIW